MKLPTLKKSNLLDKYANYQKAKWAEKQKAFLA